MKNNFDNRQISRALHHLCIEQNTCETISAASFVSAFFIPGFYSHPPAIEYADQTIDESPRIIYTFTQQDEEDQPRVS